MTRPPPIRSVFAEIRRMLGPSAPAADALRFASELVRFVARRRHWSDDDDEELLTTELEKRRLFEEWPVDLAMEDGGWMILEHETHLADSEFQIGRVHAYEASTRLLQYYYADEQYRLLPSSMSWLTVVEDPEELRALGLGYDHYSGTSLESPDYE